MAERNVFVIAAGERAVHRIECQWEEDGSKCTLGSLEWNIVVLNERIVDTQVSLLLHPKEPGGTAALEWLQDRDSGGKFVGSFTLGEDSKFAATESGSPLDAIEFEFDNTYSWFNQKEVELITVRSRAERFGMCPPLPALPPLSPMPRKEEEGAVEPELENTLPPLHLPPVCPSVGDPDTGVDTFKFVAQLDAWLASAEAFCPQRVEWHGADEVFESLAELRGICRHKLDDFNSPSAAVAAECATPG